MVGKGKAKVLGMIRGTVRKSTSLALILFITAVLSLPASADALPDRIEYISGGLMSAHVELLLDLGTGSYRLVEPEGGALAPTKTYEGRLSGDRLASIRTLAISVVAKGFKTSECVRAAEKEARRRERAQSRSHEITIDLPPMDAQVSFWVRVAGRTQSAPLDDSCWTDDAKALYRNMFADARNDYGS